MFLVASDSEATSSAESTAMESAAAGLSKLRAKTLKKGKGQLVFTVTVAARLVSRS
jgi:hypothetical protein